MSTYKVRVKWGKELFSDIEIDTAEPPEVFRAQVFALTGVQTTRQKLLLRGATLKQDTWDGAKLKQGALIVVMGSRDEDALSVEPPEQATTFMEDLSDAQANAVMDLPVGIKNLGNTCYLNAVVQCIKSIPELHAAILTYDASARSGGSDNNALLVNSIRGCYQTMNEGTTPIPLLLVDIFRTRFPSFAEQSPQGGYIQQDASECWTELLRLLQDALPSSQADKTNEHFRSSLVQQHMSGAFSCTWKCCEEGGEESSTTITPFHQLSCHISHDVNHLHTGLLSRLKENITKHSALLDRDALFTKTSSITRLPAYLTIDMVRFYYKEKQAVNAKVLKDVKFPLVLDVIDLCTPELQKRLLPYREHYKFMEDREKEDERTVKRGHNAGEAAEAKAAAATGSSIEKPAELKTIPYSFDDDLGSCNSGFYRLQAVLTHQGRTSSSGHYVAWVRISASNWIKCDDDEVTSVTEDDILRLSGGGDWHCAYVLLYGPRPLTVTEDVVITPYVSAADNKENKKQEKKDETKEEKMEA